MTQKKIAEISRKSVVFFAIGFIIFVQLLTLNNDIMTTYYVSTSGNNSNTGASSSPLKSIQEAVDRANAGDTILVKAGTYKQVKIDYKNGTQSKPITLAAAPGDEGEVTIKGDGYNSAAGLRIKESSNIIVQGLNFTKTFEGILVTSSKNITLQDNKIYDLGQNALKVTNNSSYVDILNNTISDTGNRIGKYGEGIYLGTGSKPGDRTNHVLIKGNDISKTVSEGIDVKPYISDVIVEDNLIHDIETGVSGALVIGISSGEMGGNFTNADNIIVRNNKLWNISTNSKYSDGNAISASSSATIYNNVIWNYEHRGIFIHRAPSNNEFKVYHNTVYPGDKFSSTLNDIYFSKKTSSSNVKVDLQNNIGYQGGNNISGTEKLFVDSKNGNFELSPNSSAIDAGTKISEVKTDLDGSRRVQGDAPDLGAYEYNSSPPINDNPTIPENPPENNISRVNDGLMVMYTFDAGKGNTVFDVSNVGKPLNLTINKPQNVTWDDGTLEVNAATLISSLDQATKISNAIAKSREITIEAWAIPDNDTQSGPARIVTLSKDPTNRNFTLGQQGDYYDVRLRTTKTTNNGNKPSLSAPAGTLTEGDLTHVVYTRDAKGEANLYIDSELVASDTIAGDISNWNLDYKFGLANELTGDRPWIGTLDLVAVYDQALDANEVAQNFLFGSDTSVSVS